MGAGGHFCAGGEALSLLEDEMVGECEGGLGGRGRSRTSCVRLVCGLSEGDQGRPRHWAPRGGGAREGDACAEPGVVPGGMVTPLSLFSLHHP